MKFLSFYQIGGGIIGLLTGVWAANTNLELQINLVPIGLLLFLLNEKRTRDRKKLENLL